VMGRGFVLVGISHKRGGRCGVIRDSEAVNVM